MTAIGWAAIGLTAASMSLLATALFAGLARIDALRSELGGRIDRQGAELGGRIEALRIDMGSRFDAQGADIRELRHSVQDLDRRLTRSGA